MTQHRLFSTNFVWHILLYILTKFQHDGSTNCEVNFTRTMVHRTQLRVAPCLATSLLQIKPNRYITTFQLSVLHIEGVYPLSQPNTFFSSTAYLKYSELPSIRGGPLLHPQPHDAPRRCDRNPLNVVQTIWYWYIFYIASQNSNTTLEKRFIWFHTCLKHAPDVA